MRDLERQDPLLCWKKTVSSIIETEDCVSDPVAGSSPTGRDETGSNIFVKRQGERVPPRCCDRHNWFSARPTRGAYRGSFGTGAAFFTVSVMSAVNSPRDSAGHLPAIFFLVSVLPTLMATFTASSIGSLKGTSIRSRPYSYVASALSGFTGQPRASDET